jgi:hypothetical protein
VTDALPWMVNVQVFTLLPPLEHAPDQIASRVFVTLSVIDVPVLNVAEPVLPIRPGARQAAGGHRGRDEHL